MQAVKFTVQKKASVGLPGKEGVGINFAKWVRDTFNDHDSLFPGTIISNEALFCFDESSEIIQKKTGREKPQRFRTYRTQPHHLSCLLIRKTHR